MKKPASLLTCLALATVLGGRPTTAAQPAGSTLLVIPARYTVVQFAFDVAQIRSLYLVSYDRPATSSETQIYAWDNGKAEWLQIDEADIRNGVLFHVKPQRTVLVGGAETLPASLADAATGGATPMRITSLNLADIANSLNEVLHFRKREWNWLADRYGFELTDQNAEKRRYGRYGPWGERREMSREAREHQAAPMPGALQSEVEVLAPVSAVPMPAASVETTRQTIIIPVSKSPAPAASAPIDDTVAVPAIEKGVAPEVATPAVAAPAPPADMPPENK